MKSGMTIALLSALLHSTSAAALGYSYGVFGPDPVTVKQPTTISFFFQTDTHGVASNYGGETDTGTNSILSLGNGQNGTFDFSFAVQANAYNSSVTTFNTAYRIPGVYSIKGSFDLFQQAYAPDGSLGGAAASHGVINETVTAQKDPAETAMHLSRAYDAELSLARLSLFNQLSGFSQTVGQAVGTTLGLAADAQNNPVGTVLSVIIGLAVGATAGLPGLASASIYALATVYYTAVQATETRLANDPPRSDYQTVAQYSSDPIYVNSGLGPSDDAYLEKGALLIRALLEGRQGELDSLERAEGALAAGDYAAMNRQADAMVVFQNDYTSQANALGNWFGTVTPFLKEHGADQIAGSDVLYSTYGTTSAQLTGQVAAVPEPATWMMMLLGFGAIGWGARRRRVPTAYVDCTEAIPSR